MCCSFLRPFVNKPMSLTNGSIPFASSITGQNTTFGTDPVVSTLRATDTVTSDTVQARQATLTQRLVVGTSLPNVIIENGSILCDTVDVQNFNLTGNLTTTGNISGTDVEGSTVTSLSTVAGKQVNATGTDPDAVVADIRAQAAFHATDVLRVRTDRAADGAFTMINCLANNVPVFAVYGDGTVDITGDLFALQDVSVDGVLNANGGINIGGTDPVTMGRGLVINNLTGVAAHNGIDVYFSAPGYTGDCILTRTNKAAASDFDHYRAVSNGVNQFIVRGDGQVWAREAILTDQFLRASGYSRSTNHFRVSAGTINQSTNQTLTAEQVLSGHIHRIGIAAASNITDTLPTAAALVAAIPSDLRVANMYFDFTVYVRAAATGAGGYTIAPGSGGTNLHNGYPLSFANQAHLTTSRILITNVGSGTEAYTIYRIANVSNSA